MFSLAISSICDCWRRSSPFIAAAISGSAAARGLEKKPAPFSAASRTAGEIARTAPLTSG
jgi:hypothetical protein